MNWLKQNKAKVILGVLILVAVFYFKQAGNSQSGAALISDSQSTPTSTPNISEDPRYIALMESLPKFEDYPAKVYPIPPKPKLVHESNPYGMRYWTLTENWVNKATTYDMGGHYLMSGYGTGNPGTLIIDGLTGKVFHEHGARYYSDYLESSFLVIFDPIDPQCFSSDGDYTPCYGRDSSGDSPRYVIWNGSKFKTICEPVIKAWKLISCGKGH